MFDIFGAARVLYLHSLASTWLLDTYGDDAYDTPAMETYWAVARELTNNDRAAWKAAWSMSILMYDPPVNPA
jgi:hypothetical protein